MENKEQNELSLFQDSKKLVEVAMTYLQNNNIKLTEAQLKEFVMLCGQYKLNPLKREIYAVSYGNKFNVITNYYEYLKRADATGLIDYGNVKIETDKDTNVPTIGGFIGKRKDQSKEIKMEFRFKEGSSGQSTGLTKPHFMFDKCIVANGFRRMFPNELANMPYVNEELGYGNKHNEDIVKTHIEQEEIKAPKITKELFERKD